MTARHACILVSCVGLIGVAACSGSDGGTNPGTTTGTGGGSCTAPLAVCDGSCTDLDNDPAHCGACGNSCAADTVCSGGKCVLICAGGTTECEDECVDTDVDPAHCGGCNEACETGDTCVDGSCVLACGGGASPCGEVCVDLSHDPANCGDCGAECFGSEHCDTGLCCAADEVNCLGECAELTSDAKHCGSCDEACEQGELCHEGTCGPPASCADVLAADPKTASGTQVLDPDGDGGEAPFVVYCDMESNGGGWTLIARFSNAEQEKKDSSWMQLSGDWWFTKVTEAGTTSSRSENLDMLSTAFWAVCGKELRISRTDNQDDSHLLMTTGSCLGGQTFRQLVTGFGDFTNGKGPWAVDNVRYGCDVVLGGNYATTAGFLRTLPQNCPTATIGGLNRLSFWADWQGDGSVMMIGGGGDACGRADHGIGVSEYAEASFAGAYYEKGDFGSEGDSTPDPGYALNLWVR